MKYKQKTIKQTLDRIESFKRQKRKARPSDISYLDVMIGELEWSLGIE